MMVSSRRGNKRPLLTSRKAQAGWLGLLFPPKDLDRLRKTSRFAGRFSFRGISSTADVQGRALCPGSTPGAPLQYRL